MTETH